jgi:hypothetical protein
MSAASEQGGEGARSGGWRAPAHITLPGWIRGAISSDSAALTRVAGSTARVLTVAIPAALALVGLVVAVTGAAWSQHESTEALGALGVEVGAAMWFGGAVVLGGRPHPTVLRVALLATLGAGGLLLVLIAVTASWSGAALDLAIEFGVGAVAIVVLDVLVLGLLQRGLDRVAVEGLTR